MRKVTIIDNKKVEKQNNTQRDHWEFHAIEQNKVCTISNM